MPKMTCRVHWGVLTGGTRGLALTTTEYVERVESMETPFAVSDDEVEEVLSWDLSLRAARDTFSEQAAGRVTLTDPRVKRLRYSPVGRGYRLKGAVFTGMGITGLRAGRTVLLHQWPDMDFMGVMEERTAYSWRVGAVTAVALEALGRSEFGSVCLFGAGRLAHTTLAALAHRYSLGTVDILSRTSESREQMAAYFSEQGIEARPSSDPEHAVREAELVITMTAADQVLVQRDWVDDSSVVVSMGGGLELDFDLLEQAGGLFVDDLEGCLESGDLARAQESGRYRRDWVTGSLADLLDYPDAHHWAGPTVFIPRGMAAMDVMQAYMIVRQLR